MCPAREARDRDAQGDVSLFEATPETRVLRRSMRRMDPARAVKRFRRAADGRPEGPEDVRPLEWLERTVAHLWAVAREELAVAAAKEAEEDGGWIVELHDFLADRLQAVRKDLVIQGLSGPRAIALFERVVRFHVLFGYLLSQQAAPVYDEHLGLTALRSGLGTLIDLYKEAALSSSTTVASERGGGELAHVDEFLSYNLLVQSYDAVRASGGAAVEAAGWGKLLLLLRRALTALYGGRGRCPLPPQTRLALRALVALATEDHMGFLRLYRDGAPAAAGAAAATGTAAAAAAAASGSTGSVLVRCLLHRFLPTVRRRVLEVWSKTLFKKERMPVAELGRLLAFDTPAQAKAFAAVHGVAIVETAAAGLDAWGDDSNNNANSNSKRSSSSAYIEPRLAAVSPPAVGQTYEARRQQQRALAPRQDRVVLELEREGLGALWDAMAMGGSP